MNTDFLKTDYNDANGENFAKGVGVCRHTGQFLSLIVTLSLFK